MKIFLMMLKKDLIHQIMKLRDHCLNEKQKRYADDTPNRLYRIRTKNWIEIRFKTTMLKSSLCNHRDVYTFVKGRIRITAAGDDAAVRYADERNKQVISKNCAPFTNCKSEIINAEIDCA